jgi:hypothetical protein
MLNAEMPWQARIDCEAFLRGALPFTQQEAVARRLVVYAEERGWDLVRMAMSASASAAGAGAGSSKGQRRDELRTPSISCAYCGLLACWECGEKLRVNFMS